MKNIDNLEHLGIAMLARFDLDFISKIAPDLNIYTLSNTNLHKLALFTLRLVFQIIHNQ